VTGYLGYATSWIVKRLHRVWPMSTPGSRAITRLPSDRSRTSATPHSGPSVEDNWLTKGLQEAWPDQDVQGTHFALLVMEFCDLDTLEHAIQTGTFSKPDPAIPVGKPKMEWILLTALEISHAMEHLHSHGIVHGDLKPSNILLHSSGQDGRGFTAKVADFGTSRILRRNEEYSASHGTVSYMPPELLRGGKVSPGVDVYSFGIVLWEMFSSQRPYSYSESAADVSTKVVRDNLRPKFSDAAPIDFQRLIKSCWHENRANRPTFEAIINELDRMVHNLQGTQRS